MIVKVGAPSLSFSVMSLNCSYIHSFTSILPAPNPAMHITSSLICSSVLESQLLTSILCIIVCQLQPPVRNIIPLSFQPLQGIGTFAGLINICIVDKGNHIVAMDPTLFADKMGQHPTKCMEYHQIKKMIIPIICKIRSYCLERVEMVQLSSADTFIHLLVSKSEITET